MFTIAKSVQMGVLFCLPPMKVDRKFNILIIKLQGPEYLVKQNFI